MEPEKEFECYYCEQKKKESEGFITCDVFVCNGCKDQIGEDSSGYCSCSCILSGYCDGSC